MRNSSVAVLVLCGLLCGVGTARATRIKVPQAYSTIDSAISFADAALHDTVEVTDYNNYTSFTLNKNILVYGSAATPATVRGRTEVQTGTVRGFKLRSNWNSTGGQVLRINQGGGTVPSVESCTLVADTLLAGTIGIYDVSGSCTLKNCTIDKCEYAVYPQVGGGGTVTFQNCKVYTKNVGFTDGGKIVATGTTFVSAYTMGGGNSIAFDAVQHQKLIQCIVKGFYTVFAAGCPDDTVKYNIFSGYNSMGCNSINTTDNMLGVDPLFCQAQESSVKQYSLRIDSPAIAANNSWSKDVGANDGVECAWGTLARNTTVASNATIKVLADVVVPSGKSLTINSGATFSVDNWDNTQSGSDQNKNELVVNGTLSVTGSSGSRVTFSSLQASPAEEDWYGIDGRYAQSLSIDYADVKYAQYGVKTRGKAAGTNSITNTLLRYNSSVDIQIPGDSLAAPTISGNTITVDGGTGVEFQAECGAATISGNTITGNSTTTHGILYGNLMSGSVSPTITNNTISGLTNGNAITHSSSLSATLTKNTLSNSKYGIYVSGGTPNVGSASDTTSDNIVTGNSSAGAYFTGSTTAGVVRQSRFTGNAKGLVTKGNANPNLGDSSQDGKNIFAGNTTYCLQNQSTSGTVSARGNYVNGQDPPTCHNGNFDFTGYLTTLPSSAGRNAIALQSLDGEPLSALGVTPNPMTGTAGIRFLVRRDVGRTGVQIYDVAGRLIKSFPESKYPTGEQILTWDGRSSEGEATVNGIYFVRISSEKASAQMIKILVSR